MNKVIQNVRKDVLRYLFSIEKFAKNLESPGDGLLGLITTKLMTESNNGSIINAIDRLKIKNGEHHLEIGAGNGHGLNHAAKCKPGRLIGVEISSRFRAMITDQNIPGAELYGNDAIDMSSFIPSNSVDTMVAMNVVYFLDPLSAYAKEFKRYKFMFTIII